MCKTNRAVLNCDARGTGQEKMSDADVNAETGKKGNKSMRKQLLAGVFAAFGLAALASPASADLFFNIAGVNAPSHPPGADGAVFPLPPIAIPGTFAAIPAIPGAFGFDINGMSASADLSNGVFNSTINLNASGPQTTDVLRIAIGGNDFTEPDFPLALVNGFGTSGSATALDGMIMYWSAWIGPVDGVGAPTGGVSIIGEGYLGSGVGASYSENSFTQFPLPGELPPAGTTGYQIIHIYEFSQCGTAYSDGLVANLGLVCDGPADAVLTTTQTTSATTIPEPATLGILGLGLIGLGAARRRQNRKAA